MAFSEEQRKLALTHLNKLWKGARTCMVCGNSDWSIHPSLYELREFKEGHLVIGSPLLPLMSVECTSCGNLILLNAIRAGLVKGSDGSE